ncbi:hypothetical protein HDV05_000889 [Chytridiales sp. JEL 0842]|nr:hypothetical protein HDV05_000889 [Chytridiales sp. JEL 0842]
MKLLNLLLVSTLPSLALAHGALTLPKPRFGKSFDNDDHIRQPIHMRGNLFKEGVSMVPCGGLTKGDSKVPPTVVVAGGDVKVEWEMGYWTGAALHQGTVDITLSANGDDGPWEHLSTTSMVGHSTVQDSPKGTTVKIPEGLKVGTELVLRFNWTASVTPEIFYNCADLIVSDGTGYTPPPPAPNDPIPKAPVLYNPVPDFKPVPQPSSGNPKPEVSVLVVKECPKPKTVTVTKTKTVADAALCTGLKRPKRGDMFGEEL